MLDLGAGPGFAARDLAARVGPDGRVLGLERSATYVAAGRALAAAELPQLELRQHDLLRDPWPTGPGDRPQAGFDLAWCRWVAMFLPELEPLLAGLQRALRPGGQLLLQEYIHWDSFGLHPHGVAIARFGKACQQSFRQAGGDPDVNRRLPSLLSSGGFAIDERRPLLLVGGSGSTAATWLERFVQVYGAQLQTLGLWSAADAEQAAAEIAAAQADPGSTWVGPTVLELRATR